MRARFLASRKPRRVRPDHGQQPLQLALADAELCQVPQRADEIVEVGARAALRTVPSSGARARAGPLKRRRLPRRETRRRAGQPAPGIPCSGIGRVGRRLLLIPRAPSAKRPPRRRRPRPPPPPVRCWLGVRKLGRDIRHALRVPRDDEVPFPSFPPDRHFSSLPGSFALIDSLLMFLSLALFAVEPESFRSWPQHDEPFTTIDDNRLA